MLGKTLKQNQDSKNKTIVSRELENFKTQSLKKKNRYVFYQRSEEKEGRGKIRVNKEENESNVHRLYR